MTMTDEKRPQDGMHPEIDPAAGVKADLFRSRKKSRNKALLAVLLGLAVIFYAVTILKMGAE